MTLLCMLVVLAAGVVPSKSIRHPAELVAHGTTTAATSSIQATDDLTRGTELVFAFMVHRHGDITPTAESFPFIAKSDLEAAMPLINKYGIGQLTDVGRSTAFKLGQFIRRRYNQLLSPKYKAYEIYVRTTNEPSTINTVMAAMGAVYLNQTELPKADTVPTTKDYNLAPVNCPALKEHMRNMKWTYPTKIEEWIRNASNVFGVNITGQPTAVYRIHDAYTSLISLGYKVKKEILELMPPIDYLSAEEVGIIYGYGLYIDMVAGPLLNEFFTYARKIIAGEGTPRVRVYSAHEYNVLTLAVLSHALPDQKVPKYGSLFSLELRRVVETGKYVVLPVYLSEPGAKEIYLKVENCGRLCDINSFYKSTYKNLHQEDFWRNFVCSDFTRPDLSSSSDDPPNIESRYEPYFLNLL